MSSAPMAALLENKLDGKGNVVLGLTELSDNFDEHVMVHTNPGERQLLAPNWAKVYDVFLSLMLRDVEVIGWMGPHAALLRNERLMQGSEVPILEYYNTVFVEIMRDWNLSPLPAMNRSILANIFVANLDEFLLATLVETYGHLIEAKNMYKWHLEEILRACMTLESSPRYQADKQMRKVLMENDLLTTQSTNKQVVSAVEVGSAPQTMEQIRRSDGKTWATNGMYRDMTVEQRGKFDEHCRKIRSNKHAWSGGTLLHILCNKRCLGIATTDYTLWQWHRNPEEVSQAGMYKTN